MSKAAFETIFDRDTKPLPFACMYPSCEEKPIRSHSVSRAWLRQISDEHNRVVALRPNYDTFFDANAANSDALPEFTKLDINNSKKMSTCYSFCSAHDKSVFGRIDDFRDFEINRKTAFLLAYRSISHEICDQRRIRSKMSKISVPKRSVEEFEYHKGQFEFALECIGNIYESMQVAIQRDIYRHTRYYCIVIDSIPDILCSGFYSPVDEENLSAQIRYTSYQYAPDANDQLALTIMPFQSSKGVIVLSWYGKSRKNKDFIKRLDKMNRNFLVDYLFVSVFQYISNFYIRPAFWDSLPIHKQKELHGRFESDVNPFMTGLYRSVGSNKTRFVNWSVEDIRHNVW